MTGLDLGTDTILEVAALVTDGDLQIVAEGPNLVVHHPDSVLDAMGEWCTQVRFHYQLNMSFFFKARFHSNLI